MSPASRTHVAHMRGGFYSSEQSVTDKATNARIVFENAKGEQTVLKSDLPLLEGEVIDGMFMSKKVEVLRRCDRRLRKDRRDVLLHVKATMMKIPTRSYSHAVKVFYKELFDKYGDLFEEIGVNPNNGLSSWSRRSSNCRNRSRSRSRTCTRPTSTARKLPWWIP